MTDVVAPAKSKLVAPPSLHNHLVSEIVMWPYMWLYSLFS